MRFPVPVTTLKTKIRTSVFVSFSKLRICRKTIFVFRVFLENKIMDSYLLHEIYFRLSPVGN